MSDLIVIDGDKAIFKPSFGAATVMYVTSQYSIPGIGTLTISALAGDQQARTTAAGNKKLLLKGSSFTARFAVTAPAKQPPPGPGPPIPDATQTYSGSGNFMVADLSVKAG